MNSKISLLVVMGLLFLGCKQNTPQEKVFKGYVIWEKDYTTFTNCETNKVYWLEDKTGEIGETYKKLAKKLYQEVYFELNADLLPPSTVGVSSGFDNIIEVKKIVNAQATPPESACQDTMKKPVFSCAGNDPNWSLGFGKDIKFTASYPKDTLVFFALTEPQVRDSAGVGRVFYYYTMNENYSEMQLIITEQACKTGKKYSRFTSKVLFGGEEYKGCATIKMINDEEYSAN